MLLKYVNENTRAGDLKVWYLSRDQVVVKCVVYAGGPTCCFIEIMHSSIQLCLPPGHWELWIFLQGTKKHRFVLPGVYDHLKQKVLHKASEQFPVSHQHAHLKIGAAKLFIMF